jgi:hypothetical protein
MPRDPNLPIVAFGWYYFSRSAANNRKILTNEAERELFRNLLTTTLAVHGVHLHFVHVDEKEMHLGVRGGPESLTKALGSFCEKFAHAINRSRNEKGSVFRPHAHVVLVQPGRWFLLMGRFIHWTPRLNAQGVEESSGPRVNSDAQYRSRRRTRGLDTSLILRMVSRGSRKPEVQDEAYRTLFDQPPSAAEISLFRKGSPQDSRIVGDPPFIARTARELRVTLHPRARGQPGVIDNIPPDIARMLESFHVLCQQHLPPTKAASWTRVSTLENVCSKSRQPPLPMLRALIAAHFVDSGRFRLAQLESIFQCRPRTLSAGRRKSYQRKFEALFGRPYQAALLEGRSDSALTTENYGATTDSEPIRDGARNAPGAAGTASGGNEFYTPRFRLYQ